MKKKLLFFLVAIFATSMTNAQDKMRIAVLNFNAGSGVTQEEVIGIPAALITYLTDEPKFTVVERTRIDRLIEEQKKQNSSITEENIWAKMHELLNVSKVVVGDMTRMGGQSMIDCRIVDAQTGVTDAAASGMWGNANEYREAMKSLAETLADKMFPKPAMNYTNSNMPKLAYLNSQELFILMPERNQAMERIQSFANELQSRIDQLQGELNTKLSEYENSYSTWPENVMRNKQQELQELQNRIQESMNDAEQELQNKQNDLLSPIIEKLNNAIRKVAKTNNFMIVFDSQSGSMIFYNENMLTNLAPLVKKELGIY